MSVNCQKLAQIKQKWSQLNELSGLQKAERSNDIQQLLANTENKINNQNMLETEKSKNLIKQCGRIGEMLHKIETNNSQAFKRQTQNLQRMAEYNQQTCMQMATEFSAANGQIVQQSEQVCQKLKRNNLEECQQYLDGLNKQKQNVGQICNLISDMLVSSHKFHAQYLSNLTTQIQTQISQIYQCMHERKQANKMRENRLTKMAQSMWSQLSRKIEKQEQHGKLVYQSLLTLIEDFHTQLSIDLNYP